MEFQSYLNKEMHKEDDFQEGDDDFYNELRKQVMQLTADDDDDEDERDGDGDLVDEIFKARNRGLCSGLPAGYYHKWDVSKQECAVPAPVWMINMRKTGNGTGVFIPQAVYSRRRRNRSRKKNNRANKRVEGMN
ncbi:uncharacterized protein LOC127260855 [Andrographis paniculata]|uniref:uncharacterized protein LOC127260855 n=1 Tax=Andrographis paniculata TaxID=175694 RepID=UPI0021E6FC85|nr:uncharacterized protein LOC127260855 [Andrographis paniculata]